MSSRNLPSSRFKSEVKPACAACTAMRPLRAAWPMANQRDELSALWWLTPGEAKLNASANACAVCRRVEAVKPRGHSRHAERRREIGRPDAAVEHGRTADPQAKPDHRLGACDDRLDERVGPGVRARRRDGQRRRNDDAARRRARRQMDVIDLTQPRQRAMEADVAGEAAALRQVAPSTCGLRRCARRRPRHRSCRSHAASPAHASPWKCGRALLAQRMLLSSATRSCVPQNSSAPAAARSPRSVSANSSSSGATLRIMPCWWV